MELHRFDRFGEFFVFAEERARALRTVVHRTALSAIATIDVVDQNPAWVVTSDSFHRPDGRFYRGVGVYVESYPGSVSGYRLVMIEGDEGGHVIMVCAEFDSERHFLVRMMSEPGNNGIEIDDINSRVLGTPAGQFSRDNLGLHARALRGENDDLGRPIKPVPFADLACDASLLPEETAENREDLCLLHLLRGAVRWEYRMPEDGGRFLHKWNHYGLLELTDPALIRRAEALALQFAPNYAWVSLSVMQEARRRGLLNSDFRTALSQLV